MALTQSLTQMRDATRREADLEGADALVRHPDAAVNDAVNRGLAALYRILVRTRGEQRYLSSQAISTVSGTSSYTLSTSAMHVISVEGTIDGRRVWLDSFQPEEFPMLSDTSAPWGGRPLRYALRGDNIVLLPVPQAVYSINVWFVPVPSTLSGSDTFDTIARLDDFIVWYAARELATKDKSWDLVNALKAKIEEIRVDIESIARQRDQGSVAHVADIYLHDSLGRMVRR